MRKLMIAAAIVCAAAFSQAAPVTWATSAMYFNGDGESASDTAGTKLGTGKATANLYILANADAYATVLSAVSAQDDTTAQWAKTYMANNKETATKTTAKAGTVSLTDGTDYAQDSVVYGLIIATTVQGSDTYYMANVGQYTVGSSAGTVSQMNVTLGGTSSAATTEITWNKVATEVPEPTSGLLLLLGVAGLALRRRRA